MRKEMIKRGLLSLIMALALLSGLGCQAVQTETNSEQGNSSILEMENTLKVYYLDIGQGDAIYIKTPAGEDILIDGGDLGNEEMLVNYLEDLKVDDIEVLIATHPHSDHMAGLVSVLQEFKVESVYAPKVSHTSKTFENFLKGVKAQGLSIKSAKAGVTIPLEGVTATLVGPVKAYEDLNNYSAVLHLSYGNTSFLFTGDAEEIAEADMLSQNIAADVLKVGHHGSHSSTSDRFLKAVNPKYAVISAGVDNSYGHPHRETLNKLANSNVKVYRTDQQGTIIAISDGKSLQFTVNGVTVTEQSTKTDQPAKATSSIKLVNVDRFKEVATIKNIGTIDIELTGWTLTSVAGNQVYSFPNGFILKAGASVQITSGSNGINNPPSQLLWTTNNVWNNEADPAELTNSKGEKIDAIP